MTVERDYFRQMGLHENAAADVSGHAPASATSRTRTLSYATGVLIWEGRPWLERRFADVESLRPVVRCFFGRNRNANVVRLAGGSKRTVFLTMVRRQVLSMPEDSRLLAGRPSEGATISRSVLAPVGSPPFETRPAPGVGGLRFGDPVADGQGDCRENRRVEDVAGQLETLLETDQWRRAPLAGACRLAAAMQPSVHVHSGRWRSLRRAAVARGVVRGSHARPRAGQGRRSRGATGRAPVAGSLAETHSWPSRSNRVRPCLWSTQLGPDHVLLDRRGEPVL